MKEKIKPIFIIVSSLILGWLANDFLKDDLRVETKDQATTLSFPKPVHAENIEDRLSKDMTKVESGAETTSKKFYKSFANAKSECTIDGEEEMCRWYIGLHSAIGDFEAADKIKKLSCKNLRNNDHCFQLIQKQGQQYEIAKTVLNESCLSENAEACEFLLEKSFTDNDKAQIIKLVSQICKVNMYKCHTGVLRAAKSGVLTLDMIQKMGLCNKEKPYSCYTYGVIQNFSGNFERAFHSFDDGCKWGDSSSCMAAGIMSYMNNHQEEMVSYYNRACSMGSQSSCNFLKLFD